MADLVCAIWYRPDYYADEQLYALTDSSTTAAKMLLEDEVITGDTLVYCGSEEEGVCITKKLKEVAGDNKVEFIARALAAVGKYSFGNWSMEVRSVYDKDDYAAEDRIYNRHISDACGG